MNTQGRIIDPLIIWNMFQNRIERMSEFPEFAEDKELLLKNVEDLKKEDKLTIGILNFLIERLDALMYNGCLYDERDFS